MCVWYVCVWYMCVSILITKSRSLKPQAYFPHFQFGPRALGHRSMLCYPDRESLKEKLNKYVVSMFIGTFESLKNDLMNRTCLSLILCYRDH